MSRRMQLSEPMRRVLCAAKMERVGAGNRSAKVLRIGDQVYTGYQEIAFWVLANDVALRRALGPINTKQANGKFVSPRWIALVTGIADFFHDAEDGPHLPRTNLRGRFRELKRDAA